LNDDKAQVVITVSRALKGAWVASSRAEGKKLTDWITEGVSMIQDRHRFTLDLPALEPFERYVLALGDAEARDLLKKVRALDAKDEYVTVAVKVAKAYLEKRVCLADGIADHALFRDINRDSLHLINQFYPQLSHLELIEVLCDSTKD
jgi:hypothetical protein